jgi:SagB-type dehydrogenase family enzyme
MALPAPSGRLFPLAVNGDEGAGDSLERTILRRGSTREFAREPISFTQLSAMIRSATRGMPADFLESPDSTLNHLYVIALAVEGLPPGAYVYHRDREALELLKEGDFRREGGFLGLEQELPADAAADVFFLTDLKKVLDRFGSRGYRAAELEAGVMGGKLYLAAYAQRLGATGLTFYDDEVTEFFSPHAAGKSVMFLMALGRSALRPAK